uniref:DDE-1 domain-containing protein n=1 Tax=Ditylenchus dipsaci TaxID=166011 RepID=A0A915CYY7_9BILA
MTADYINRVFGSSMFGNRLLVWDAFRCHISESTKKRLHRQRLHTAVIPGGCTKFIQPADVSWNAPFKAKFQRLYNNWIANEDRMEWTANGNPRPPAMNVYLDWICEAWNAIPKEAIVKSFKDCGITNSYDGSEDYLIHAFKEHGPIAGGLQILSDARILAENTPTFAEDVDAEQDEENGYESDASLLSNEE